MSQQQVLSSDDVRAWSTNLYIYTATTVWLFHDYILTLASERRCIWRRQASSVTVVFFIVRYATLFKQSLKVAQFISWGAFLGPRPGDAACHIVLRADAVLKGVIYASVSAFASIRIYAISGKNTKLAGAVLGLGLAYAFSNLYTNNIGAFRALSSPLSGCVQMLAPDDPTGIARVFRTARSTSTAWKVAAYLGTACGILSELVVQAYTWERTLFVRRRLRSMQTDSSFYHLLRRDGGISFIVISVWSVATRIDTRADLASMTIPGISVFICRCLVSLRQVRLAAGDPAKAGTARTNAIARFVGNAGAPLRTKSTECGDGEFEEADEVVYVEDNPLMAGLLPEMGRLRDIGALGA